MKMGEAQRRRIEVRNKTEVWLYVRKTPHGIDANRAKQEVTQHKKTKQKERCLGESFCSFGKHLENSGNCEFAVLLGPLVSRSVKNSSILSIAPISMSFLSEIY